MDIDKFDKVTGPRYQVRTIVNGKPTQRTRTFESLREAEEYMKIQRFSDDYTFEVYEVITTKRSLGIY